MENLKNIVMLIDADNTQLSKIEDVIPVSYTHLTLPTKLEV